MKRVLCVVLCYDAVCYVFCVMMRCVCVVLGYDEGCCLLFWVVMYCVFSGCEPL